MSAIVFDLDYTLYDADQYYHGAFRGIATSLAERYNRDADELFASVAEHWKIRSSRYPRLFDLFLANNDLPSDEVAHCVTLLHGHQGEGLTLYPDAERLLAALPEEVKTGIVTDGNPMMQRHKVRALGLVHRCDAICFTADGGEAWRKPAPFAFQCVLRQLEVRPEDAIYVGDNPRTDALGALVAGMRAFRLRRGPFAQEEIRERYFQREISSLEELLTELRPAGVRFSEGS